MSIIPHVDAFAVVWSSPQMTGLAFWYFLSERQAQLALMDFHQRGRKASLQPVTVPVTTTFADERGPVGIAS